MTVVDVYHHMRENRLPTGYMDPHMNDTDPIAAAPAGKTYILPTSYRTSSFAVARVNIIKNVKIRVTLS